MENKKEINKKKAGIVIGALSAVVAILVVTANFGVINTNEDVLEWHVIAEIDSLDPLGENDPGASTSGWLATFCLDYAETPATCLASNSTDGDYDTWGNVSGYVDTDDTDTDLKSEDPFYFVVRCCFNDTVQDGANFMGSRCRCTLTVSGDETISSLPMIGDATNASGGGIVSANGTGSMIWINFYWDDNNDGYRITDDGSLTWSILIEAKY